MDIFSLIFFFHSGKGPVNAKTIDNRLSDQPLVMLVKILITVEEDLNVPFNICRSKSENIPLFSSD